MDTLAELLRAEIEARGPIPFRDFMERALYDPAHGYYASGRAAIGRSGDFITNVSVGPLFGALLGRQFGEMWERLGRPETFTIVEQGAHRGDFARDVLGHLDRHAPELAARIGYTIIEPGERAREAQRATLGEAAARTRWVATPAELPPFTGVHFSNELIDAFPVHLVKRCGGEWRERHVEWRDGALAWVDLAPSTDGLRAAVAALPERPEGYETEINLAALEWMDAIAAKLERGYVLAIDYGYPREEFLRPERTSGTLSAYASHRREPNPLARPGEIDLTAHVEFTSLTERARVRGLEVAGFTDQHHFIVGLSRLHFTDATALDATAQKELRALQTLMHPTFMGRAFKVLGLARGVANSPPLAGFAFAPPAPAALGLAD